MSGLTFHGSNFFRQRLVLSTISGKSVHLKNIRGTSDEPGIKDYEESFLDLLKLITNGTEFEIKETGTVVKYKPGLLDPVREELFHNCCISRGIGYYLEALICLAPFFKRPVKITLMGVTNNSIDPSVDAIMHSSLPVLKKFVWNNETLEINIKSRGLPPEGGGKVEFCCPIVNNIPPIIYLDPGNLKRIRGYAYSARVSPSMSSRMVDSAKYLLPKCLRGRLSPSSIYIYTDHRKGEHSGKSPGFGLILIAESTTGVFYSAEAISNQSGDDFIVPEDVAKKACFNLLKEMSRGGCIDSNNQSLACLFMALSSPDVSKIKTGPLTLYTMKFLQNIEDFLQVRMKLETEKNENNERGAHKVILTCVGTGFSNMSRSVS